ncbi:MAG: dienelactone hydrolase family protein [Rhodospirillaceae bacterium]
MSDELIDLDCDEQCFSTKPITRRTFGIGTVAAAGLVSGAGTTSAALPVTETDVMIETPDGTCDAVFFHPTEGKHPGVLKWPDIRGLRDAFRDMGRRLAGEGYAVLVPNPFYRDGPAPLPGPDFNFATDRQMVMGLMGNLVAEGAAERDATAFVNWIDKQDAVDTAKKMGTTGYCMGGPLTMRTAAHVPNRIGAAGSFHGGGLVTDRPSSPHLMIPKMQVSYHVAIAADDDSKEPDAKNVLRAAFDDAGVPATIEVYEGALHGWCVPDSSSYNEVQAERAWSTLMDLFKSTIA